MITFFKNTTNTVFAVQSSTSLNKENFSKLEWLFGNANSIDSDQINGNYIGPRSEMITPWSTNAVEITQNMGIEGILRIEEFTQESDVFDPMLQRKYAGLNQTMFDLDVAPEDILDIDDITTYNKQEGLALNNEEIEYLEGVSKDLGRK